MIAFSCNVPQTALTFGNYSTSGPIRLLAFFLEGNRGSGRGGGATGAYNVCLSRPQTTGPENPRDSPLSRPRSSDQPVYIHLRGAGMRGAHGGDADSGKGFFLRGS